MDLVSLKPTGNKHERCDEEEPEEKKMRFQSVTDRQVNDTYCSVNGQVQTPILHKTDVVRIDRASGSQTNRNKDVSQEQITPDNLSTDYSRERNPLIANSIHLEDSSLLPCGSEPTTLKELSLKVGSLDKNLENINIRNEKTRKITSESDLSIPEESSKSIKDLAQFDSKESRQVSIQDEDPNTFKTKTATKAYVELSDIIEDGGGKDSLEAWNVFERDQGSMSSGIICDMESSSGNDIYIAKEYSEKRQETGKQQSTLIVEGGLIKEVSPAFSSVNQTEENNEIINSSKNSDVITNDSNESEDEDDSEKYLFRLLRPGESYLTGIFPKNRDSNTSIEMHVRNGSRSRKGSKFISCSKSLNKIKLFAGMIRKSTQHKARQIVRIDRDLIGKNVKEIDLTDKTMQETYLISYRAKRNSLKFREMILLPKTCIPAASIKRIGQVRNGSITIDEYEIADTCNKSKKDSDKADNTTFKLPCDMKLRLF